MPREGSRLSVEVRSRQQRRSVGACINTRGSREQPEIPARLADDKRVSRDVAVHARQVPDSHVGCASGGINIIVLDQRNNVSAHRQGRIAYHDIIDDLRASIVAARGDARAAIRNDRIIDQPWAARAYRRGPRNPITIVFDDEVLYNVRIGVVGHGHAIPVVAADDVVPDRRTACLPHADSPAVVFQGVALHQRGAGERELYCPARAASDRVAPNDRRALQVNRAGVAVNPSTAINDRVGNDGR